MFFIFNLNSSIISSSSKTFWLIFRSEEHTSELQSQSNLVCRLLLEKKKKFLYPITPHFISDLVIWVTICTITTEIHFYHNLASIVSLTQYYTTETYAVIQRTIIYG